MKKSLRKGVTLLALGCIIANIWVLFLTDWARELKSWEARFDVEVEEEVEQSTYDTTVTGKPTTSQVIQAIHPYSKQFIYVSPGCESVHPPKGNVFLLILVACRPSEINDRSLIRKTWGGVKVHKGKPILVRFLIASQKTLEWSLMKEIDEYGDIIQGDFEDSYKNMTLKVLMGLRWAGIMCPNATYVMNLDSDMFVNVFNLVSLLENSPRKKFAIGFVRKNAKPFRRKNIKWHTPVEMYPNNTYPPYLNGPAYVMSGDLPGHIFDQSAHVRYLPWDDVFIGLVMQRIGVTPVNGAHFEDYPNLKVTSAVLNAIRIGIATHVAHQNEPNPTLIEIWTNVSKSILSQ